MIRLISTLILMLAIATMPGQAAAQSTYLGFVGGLNVSDLNFEDVGSSGSTNSFHAGVFANFSVGQSLSIQPELLYTVKGAEVVDFGPVLGQDLKLTYLQIPVLARLSFPANSNTRGHIFAGPAVAFELNCKVEGEVLTLDTSVDCASFGGGEGGPIDTSSTDFSIMFGGGLNFDLNGTLLFLDARFDVGISDIEDRTGLASVRNRTLMLSAGVGFPVGR